MEQGTKTFNAGCSLMGIGALFMFLAVINAPSGPHRWRFIIVCFAVGMIVEVIAVGKVIRGTLDSQSTGKTWSTWGPCIVPIVLAAAAVAAWFALPGLQERVHELLPRREEQAPESPAEEPEKTAEPAKTEPVVKTKTRKKTFKDDLERALFEGVDDEPSKTD